MFVVGAPTLLEARDSGGRGGRGKDGHKTNLTKGHQKADEEVWVNWP
jgi:hypothetical protein